MSHSALFLLMLVAIDQIHSGLSFQAVQHESENHDAEKRAVTVSISAGVSELPISEHLTPLMSRHKDSVQAPKMTSTLLEVSAGADFPEFPISELSISSFQGPKLARRIEHEHPKPLESSPKEGAEPHKMTSVLLEVSAGASFSELPGRQLLSSQGQKIVRRIEHEYLTPVGSGVAESAEAHKMTSALVDDAKANRTFLTVGHTHSGELSVNRARLDASDTVIYVIVGTALSAVVVLLVLMLVKSRQELGEVQDSLPANTLSRYASKKTITKGKKPLSEYEAAVRIQSCFSKHAENTRKGNARPGKAYDVGNAHALVDQYNAEPKEPEA